MIKQPLPGQFANSMRLAFTQGLADAYNVRNKTTSAVARSLGTTAGLTNWVKHDDATKQGA